jgi:hypothetical protein
VLFTVLTVAAHIHPRHIPDAFPIIVVVPIPSMLRIVSGVPNTRLDLPCHTRTLELSVWDQHATLQEGETDLPESRFPPTPILAVAASSRFADVPKPKPHRPLFSHELPMKP